MLRRAYYHSLTGSAIISMGRYLIVFIGDEAHILPNPEARNVSGMIDVDANGFDTLDRIYEKIKGAYADTTEEQTPTLGTGKEAV